MNNIVGKRREPLSDIDPEIIAGAEKRIFLSVIKSEGEHPVQFSQTCFAVFRQEVKQDFGIGIGPEMMPACLQFTADFPEIIDFAVVDKTVSSVFSEHGLMPCGRKVYDG